METCADPKWSEQQLTTDEAIQFAKEKAYEKMSHDEIVRFQLFQKKLAMPFGVFHEALEAALGRPVYTHELAFIDSIKEEYLGTRKAPTMDEIINLIPEDKRVIIGQ